MFSRTGRVRLPLELQRLRRRRIARTRQREGSNESCDETADVAGGRGWPINIKDEWYKELGFEQVVDPGDDDGGDDDEDTIWLKEQIDAIKLWMAAAENQIADVQDETTMLKAWKQKMAEANKE